MSKAHDELRSFLAHYTDGEISPAAIRVAELLDRWLGLHHVDASALRKTNWSDPRAIFLKIYAGCMSGELATFDFDRMTSLVFLAHELGIRVAVSPISYRYFEITFHPRTRSGQMSERHPTLDEAVAMFKRAGVPVWQPAAAAEASPS